MRASRQTRSPSQETMPIPCLSGTVPRKDFEGVRPRVLGPNTRTELCTVRRTTTGRSAARCRGRGGIESVVFVTAEKQRGDDPRGVFAWTCVGSGGPVVTSGRAHGFSRDRITTGPRASRNDGVCTIGPRSEWCRARYAPCSVCASSSRSPPTTHEIHGQHLQAYRRRRN